MIERTEGGEVTLLVPRAATLQKKDKRAKKAGVTGQKRKKAG
jgi:hypothetical protein